MERFFYAPPEAFSSIGTVVLPQDEAKHIVKVLRLRAGAVITVVDGEGMGARVQIERADRDGVYGRIISKHQNLGESDQKFTIGLALLKQQRRYNFFLEKSVELGVTGIIPIITERIESRSWRPDRAMQIMIAALKQCNRSRLPTLHSPTPFDQLVGSGVLIADPVAETSFWTEVNRINDSMVMLIGPEGGFTENERQLAISRGASLVHLGPRRLRAETAAICSATAFMLTGYNRNTQRLKQ